MKNPRIIIILSVFLIATFLVLLFQSNYDKEGATVKTPFGITVQFGDKNIAKFSFPKNLSSDIENIIEQEQGRFSVLVKNIETGESIEINEKDKYISASLYKIPFAIAILQQIETGKISLGTILVYEERHSIGGTGTLQNISFGEALTVEQLLSYLIKESDNVAQAMLFDVMDIQQLLNIAGNEGFEFATVKDTTHILEGLYKGNYLNKENTEFLLNLMSETSFDDRINSGLPESIVFSHKIGNWPEIGTWHDCGITLNTLNPIVICIMSEETSLKTFIQVSQNVAKTVFRHYLN